jgi:hypothetical protein
MPPQPSETVPQLSPAGQLVIGMQHTPLMQGSPAGHASPQVPQFFGSLDNVVHTLPQRFGGPVVGQAHAPAVHT